ncbi:MAG: class I SAM-dependent methyltransferase [Thermoplasmata archaeon]
MKDTEENYDRMSNVYNVASNPFEEKYRRIGVSLMDIEEGGRYLDIGHGTGEALISIAEDFKENVSLYGVDISRGMTDIAGRKLEKLGLEDRVELILADARELPFGDSYFHGVFSSFTIEIMNDEDLDKVLENIKRVMRESGKFVGISLSKHGGSIVKDIYEKVQNFAPNIVDCRLIDLKSKLENTGFDVVYHERRDKFGLPVDIVSARP